MSCVDDREGFNRNIAETNDRPASQTVRHCKRVLAISGLRIPDGAAGLERRQGRDRGCNRD
jgi:hypothetical protein